MSRKAAIATWGKKWHASECTSRAYTEVLQGPPDGGLSQGLRAIAKDTQLSHAFTGKYAQRFHAERATSSACECGFDPQTVNHVVFDRPRYNAARSASPRFDFDDRTGRPISVYTGCQPYQCAA